MCVLGNQVCIGYIGIFIVKDVKNVRNSSVCRLFIICILRIEKFLEVKVWFIRVGIFVVFVFVNIVIIVISISIELRNV